MYQHPLSNIELLTWLTHHKDIPPLLGGVYSRDTLPKKQHYSPALYIVNTAPASHPTGIHWIAMLIGNGTSEYFDSLGHKPCHEFRDFLGPHYVYCRERLQSLSALSCGYYCLYYAVCRAQHLSFDRIVQDLYNSDDHSVMHSVQQIQPLKVVTGSGIKRCL